MPKPKNVVDMPLYFPPKGIAYSTSRQLFFTGRMRFYRKWEYEMINHDGNISGLSYKKFVKFFDSKTHFFNCSSCRKLKFPLVEKIDTKARGQFGPRVRKFREYVPYQTILEEVFERVQKPRNEVAISKTESLNKILYGTGFRAL